MWDNLVGRRRKRPWPNVTNYIVNIWRDWGETCQNSRSLCRNWKPGTAHPPPKTLRPRPSLTPNHLRMLREGMKGRDATLVRIMWKQLRTNSYGAEISTENSAHDKYHILSLNLLKPTGYVMHKQFNIQQLYALPTLYLCVLYLSENKQRLVPLTA